MGCRTTWEEWRSGFKTTEGGGTVEESQEQPGEKTDGAGSAGSTGSPVRIQICPKTTVKISVFFCLRKAEQSLHDRRALDMRVRSANTPGPVQCFMKYFPFAEKGLLSVHRHCKSTSGSSWWKHTNCTKLHKQVIHNPRGLLCGTASQVQR